MIDLELLAQILIVVLGIPSMFLLTSKKKRLRKWGGWIGVASQPAYFYAEIVEEQWGMIVVSAIYAILFVRAVFNNKDDQTNQETREDT